MICTGCGACFGELHNMRSLATEGGNDSFPASGHFVIGADIGTTTIAMACVSPEGVVCDTYVGLNLQGEYGRDVLSRIVAAEDPEKAEKMRVSVLGFLEEGVRRFLGDVIPDDLRMSIACNMTMKYLLLGRDPQELGKAPFHASYPGRERVRVCGIEAEVLPGFSAFVGGDLYAGRLAAAWGAVQGPRTLLVDLGTNGECLLWDEKGICGCAAAAGPAFEGGAGRGVWGADLVHFLAELRREGFVDETGLLADPYFEEGILIGGIRMTQKEIRDLQLAKSAIAVGTQTLVKEGGMPDRVVLAGGFGYFLQPENAIAIGLLPEDFAGKIVPGGNTALRGAILDASDLTVTPPGQVLDPTGRLLAGMEEAHREENAPGAKILNLAQLPDFQEEFMQHTELAPFRLMKE
ncbi:MAG: ASKHA domain-containing protein [Lachnospiraceae bacterium]|nr:ASKHA domain-containing protein [Lachnospiraceae bacterium]